MKSIISVFRIMDKHCNISMIKQRQILQHQVKKYTTIKKYTATVGKHTNTAIVGKYTNTAIVGKHKYCNSR